MINKVIYYKEVSALSSNDLERMGQIIQMNGELKDLSSAQPSSLFSRLDRLKKQQKHLLPYVLTGIVTLGLVGTFYSHSSLSKIQSITFSGNTFLSKATVLELTGLSYDASVLSVRPSSMAKQIEAHPLVKTAKLSFKGLNEVVITIEEERVLGCVADDQRLKLLLPSGELVDSSVMNGQTCQGVFFYDMDNLPEDMNLLYLTTALNELSESFLALIDAVYYEPDLGDIYRFSIHLKDGNIIKVNTYTMAEKLSYYEELRQKVKATYGDVRGTFHLDVGDRFVVHESDLEEAITFFEELNQPESEE